MQRRGHNDSRHFSDGRYGEKANALHAARVYRDVLLLRRRSVTRREGCQIRKKTNRSGIAGVTRIEAWEWSRGRHIRRRDWDAQWPTHTGRAVHKKFAISKDGERRAFQLAMIARRSGLRTLARAPFLQMLERYHIIPSTSTPTRINNTCNTRERHETVVRNGYSSLSR